MSGKRYTDELTSEVGKQVIEHGRSVREVSLRLGISIDSLYVWVRDQRKSPGATGGQFVISRGAPITVRAQAGNRGARHPKNSTAYFAKQSG